VTHERECLGTAIADAAQDGSRVDQSPADDES
jgi:hypothetical protein